MSDTGTPLSRDALIQHLTIAMAAANRTPPILRGLLLKFLLAGGRRGELHATVRHLVTGTRLTLVLSVVLFLLLTLQQCSAPGPEG